MGAEPPGERSLRSSFRVCFLIFCTLTFHLYKIGGPPPARVQASGGNTQCRREDQPVGAALSP